MVYGVDDGMGQEEAGRSGSGTEEESAPIFGRFLGNTEARERTSETLEPVDVDFTELPLQTSGQAEDDLVCQVCGIPLTYAGRGRKPKFCDEHKKQPSARTTGGRSRQATAKGPNRAVQEGLADNIRLIGSGVGMAMPTTGYVLFEDSDTFAQAIVRLCAGNPRAMKALSKAAQASPAFQVGKSLARIGTAVNVDTGRMQPDIALSRGLGVFHAWQETHPGESARTTKEYVVGEPPTVSYLHTG